MDALTEVLKSVQLRSIVRCRADLSAPWGVEIDRTNQAAFHIIVQGSCWLEVEGRKEPISLVGGDFAVLSKGTAHRLRDALDSPVNSPISRPEDLFAVPPCQGQLRVQYGGGAPTTVLCGNACFEDHEMNPLLPALPSLILIKGKNGKAVEWLDSTLQAIAWETADNHPGAEMMITYLCNILFIQAIRAYLANLQQQDNGGWLRALRDPQLSVVLALIHQSPEKNWTVDSLAKQVNLSRSTFAARFKERVGEAPFQYLTRWRMYRAARLLRSTDLSLVVIAQQVGYQSEAAFSKAFKRQIRQSPGEYRKSQH